MSKHPGIIFFFSKFFGELAGNGGFDNPREPTLNMADSDPRDNNQQKNDSTADLDVGRQPVQKELDFEQDDASSSPLVPPNLPAPKPEDLRFITSPKYDETPKGPPPNRLRANMSISTYRHSPESEASSSNSITPFTPYSPASACSSSSVLFDDRTPVTVRRSEMTIQVPSQESDGHTPRTSKSFKVIAIGQPNSNLALYGWPHK